MIIYLLKIYLQNAIFRNKLSSSKKSMLFMIFL